MARIDVLLNNAGISMNKPSLELTPDDWRRAIDIDLSGVFFCTQAAARRMVRRGGGNILSTASMWGRPRRPGALLRGQGRRGVADQVAGGRMGGAQHPRQRSVPATPARRWSIRCWRAAPWTARTLLARTPLRRFGTPEEMAEVALFLASDAAAFITGHALVSDGGWTADGF